MRLKRWGVEIYDLRKKDPQATILLPRRFWTLWWATDYASHRIIAHRRSDGQWYHAFRPVKVKDWHAKNDRFMEGMR